MVKLGADEKTIELELQKQGLGEFSLERTFATHDMTDYLEILGQTAGGPRGIPGQPGGVKPRLHVEQPPFDRERWLEENPP
jgi:hypothetical protein